MALLENAIESLDRLKKAELARTGVAEAQALETLLEEISASALAINRLSTHSQLLRGEGVSLSVTPGIGKVIETTSQIATRFREVPRSNTLKQGSRWINLTKKLREIEELLKKSQTQDWGNYFNTHLFGGPLPEQVRTTFVPTPENEKALANYTDIFRKFIVFRSQIPKTGEEFKILRQYSNQLAAIVFQKDMPEDVRKFFEAMATNTGASLELLTSEVLEWLGKKKLLANYVARARN